MELQWCTDAHIKAVAAEGPFDFVVCNDLLYTPGNIELIGSTLAPLMHVRLLLSPPSLPRHPSAQVAWGIA
eukprot:935669-Rhodomonas_salina.1